MNEAQILGFMDEMEKIAHGDSSLRPHPSIMAAHLLKEAAFMADVGLPFVNKVVSDAKGFGHMGAEMGSQFVKSIPGKASKFVKDAPANARRAVRHVGNDVGGAIKDFAHPVNNAKKGFTKGVDNFKNGKLLGSNLLNKAIVAKGLYDTGSSVIRKEDPTGQGRSRLHRGLEAAGGAVGGMIGYRRGIVGGMLAHHIGRTAGNLAGKTVDLARGYRPTYASEPQGVY